MFRNARQEYTGGHENLDWLMADMVAGNIVFGKAELEDAARDVMALMTPPETAHHVVLEEVTPDSDSSTDDSHHAGDLMLEAERRISTRSDLSQEFQASLECMLNDPAVQVACTRALIQNHHFGRLVESSEGFSQDQLNRLLPAAAAAAAQAPEEGVGGPMEALVARLGRGLERLGQLMAPARDAVGRVLIEIGYRINGLLRRPFKESVVAAGQGSEPRRGGEVWWANVLMTVGCAVIALLLLKRGEFPMRAAGASLGAGMAAGGAGMSAFGRKKGGKPSSPAASGAAEPAIV
ncbi:hypothetical protein WJX81_000127 [Elliptochloris bilobata]|uniref:Uncharacterized protein n=1 Tax=Elliptochloris bilobata TaxID=381761 RepID=A0AAW1RKT7_9CHLO